MNRKLTVLLCAVCLVLLCFWAVYMRDDKDEVRVIRDRGELRVGVKVDVPRFGYLNPATGKIEGMEIDLVRALAKDILGNENAVKLVSITAQTRGVMLDNGELDVVIATFTITEDRKKRFNFSRPYFTDELGYLIRADSPIKTPEDLDGKIAGVAQSSTAQAAFEGERARLGIDVTLREYASYPEIKAALTNGAVDVFISDKSILYGYLDGSCVLLSDGFNPQQYGIASKLGNKKLAAHIDALLDKLEKNGELSKILEKWGLKLD